MPPSRYFLRNLALGLLIAAAVVAYEAARWAWRMAAWLWGAGWPGR